MSDLQRRLMREGWHGALLKAAGMGVGLFTSWATVHYLGADDYGVFTTCLALVAVVTSIAGFGLSLSVMPFITRAERAGDLGAQRLLARRALTTVVGLGLALAVAMLALGGPLRALFDAADVFTAALAALLPYAILAPCQYTLGGIMAARGKITTVFAVSFVARPLGLVLTLGALFLLAALGVPGERLVWFGLGLAALDLVVAITLWRRYVPRAPTAPARLDPRWSSRRLLRASAPVAANGFVGSLEGITNKILLGAITQRLVEVGVFAIAQKFVVFANIPAMLISDSFNPIATRLHAEGRHGELRDLFRLTAFIGFAGAALVVLAVLLWAPVVLLAFPAELHEAYLPLTVLVIPPLLNIAVGPVRGTLVMIERTRVLPWAAALSLAVDVALCFALIPAHGIMGAALASTAARLIQRLVLAVALWRVSTIHAFGPLMVRFLAPFIGAGALALLTARALPGLWGPLAGTAVTAAWSLPFALWFARRHDIRLRSLVRFKLPWS